jgi:ribose transport system substrate-binding protein
MNYFSMKLVGLVALALLLSLMPGGCETRRRIRIAMVPRTTGVVLWEAERAGAIAAAGKHGFEIYWNAPTREDDVEGQIALLERIRKADFAGVVLAPDQALALMTPVGKIVSSGIPTVIVSSPLPLAPRSGLCYIVNDDEESGRMAAKRVALQLRGKGAVALLSLDPRLLGIMAQVRAFEDFLQHHYPAIHVVDRRLGAFNGAEAQQITSEIIDAHPQLDALVSFTSVATRGASLTLRSRDPQARIKLIGYEQDGDIIAAVSEGKIDAVLAEDSYQMGYRAIESIACFRQGKPVAPRVLLKPLLITRENVNSPETKKALNFGWSEGP